VAGFHDESGVAVDFKVVPPEAVPLYRFAIRIHNTAVSGDCSIGTGDFNGSRIACSSFI